jgi:tetratricopeptide (TPR) repeat protein
MAYFVKALLEEESIGPDKALESFRKTLELDPSNADLALQLSQDYLRRGDTVQALAVLKDSLKAKPKNADLALALSLIYLRQLQKPELATRYANLAMQAEPSRLAPYEVLIEISLSQGQRTKAEAILDQANRSKSTDPSFWLSLAELTGRLAQGSGAVDSSEVAERMAACLEKAVALGKEDPVSLARAGDLYALSRSVEKAMAAYQQAYSLKASLPQLRQKLAAGHIELGQSAEAIAILEEIVKLNPLDLRAYDQLSQLHLRAGDISKAAASARQALLIEPQIIDRHLLVADLLFKSQDFPAAADTLAEARRLFPSTPRLTYFHAMALSQSKRHEEAMKTFDEAAKEAANLQPEMLNADFYFDFGAASEQAGKIEEAAKHFRRSIALDASNAARSYNYLGYMWVDRNENLEEAGQLIRRAVELEPTNGAYLDSLGWLYFRQGKYEDALATLLRAAEHLSEPDAVVFDHIADTYLKLGKSSEAVIFWKKALALDPENKSIASKLDTATNAVAQQPRSKKE